MLRSHLLITTVIVYLITVAFSPASPAPAAPDCKLFVPNVFSPNGDGLNDKFKAFTDCGLNTFEMRVFTRWGALVYEGKSINDGWNGQYRGQVAKSDSYVYYIKYTFDGDEKLEEIATGEVTLLR